MIVFLLLMFKLLQKCDIIVLNRKEHCKLMKLILGNYNSKLEFDEAPSLKKTLVDAIRSHTSVDDPKRFMSPAFKRHYWDGKIHFYDLEKDTFPSGLLNDVVQAFKEVQLRYPQVTLEYKDNRGARVEGKPDDDIVLLNGDEEPIHLRDYQVGAIKASFEQQKGITLLSTGAGKTEVASGIIKYALPVVHRRDRIVFMVHSTEIARQAKARIEKRLNIPVGFWGDGEKDFKQVTVCMVKTVNSALTPPEDTIKLTSNKDKGLQKFVKEFYPVLKGKPNIVLLAKSLLKNYRGKYKYDEDVKKILMDIVHSDVSGKQLEKALDWYPKQYDKLLAKKNKKGFDKYNEALEFLDDVRVVITDECHHSVSKTYLNVYNHLENARMNIGLTGTIDDSNVALQKQLMANFGMILYRVRNKEMSDREFSSKLSITLVPVTEPQAPQLAQLAQTRVIAVPQAQRKLMEYQTVYDAGIVHNDYRNTLIMQFAKRLYQKGDGTTLIVVDKVEHGEILSDLLTENGVANAFMQGSNTTEERKVMLDGVNQGTLKVLIGTQLIDEGIDLPNLKYLLYTAGGKSQRQLLQRVGRILRRSSTKVTAEVYDFQDQTHTMLYNQAKRRVAIYKDEEFKINNSLD